MAVDCTVDGTVDGTVDRTVDCTAGGNGNCNMVSLSC